MKRLLSAFWLLCCALLPLSLISAQDEGGITLDIIGIDPIDLSQILIHTSILDGSGQLISGLDVDNFSIAGDLEGLASVTRVENITDDELAFASVLVIDTSSSMADRPLTQAKQAARQYISALGPDDPVAIVSFSSRVRVASDFTTDRDALLRVIDNLSYGGQTALYDATRRGIELAVQAPYPRRAVVILSDGGEYGNVSQYTRDESVRAATINGVPVYTVGLGWNIDERFLTLVSSESNADFYSSPSSDELIGVYERLAFLFSTQYIVTISADVPEDGMRYDFTLVVTTPDGRSTAGAATMRAPIPVPLLYLPDDLFSDALAEDTTIRVEIRADQDIESIEYALDGEVVSTEPEYTIEPETLAPGEHRLDVTVSDVEGDIGRLRRDFEIAPLPPTVSEDFAPAAEAEVAQAEVISVDAGGQTEIIQVEFLVDGEVVKVDQEAPYDFNLDPYALSPGEHILSIRATNAAGQSTTVDQKFDVVRMPPRLDLQGVSSEAVVSDTFSGAVRAMGQSPITSLSIEPNVGAVVVEEGQLSFSFDAEDLPPGVNTIAVRAVDAAGGETVETFEIEVQALPPTMALSGLAVNATLAGERDVNVQAGGQTEITRIEVSYDGGPAQPVEDGVFTVPAQELGDGEHELEVTVTNAGGESASMSLPFTVDLPPTPTFTPSPTHTATLTFDAVADARAQRHAHSHHHLDAAADSHRFANGDRRADVNAYGFADSDQYSASDQQQYAFADEHAAADKHGHA